MIDLETIRRSAFVEHGPAPFRLAAEGPLADTTFAVKDLFDVAGAPTACGNRDRLRDDGPAVTTAPSVLAPLMAGALFVGKTQTDEVACGMFGENDDFGTPINPSAPDRVPGGSSSGSAVAVAAGLCDFALGTDTGGSIRVPASFCGVVGLRTTYGRIPTAGVMAMAPSFDSVGLLARDGETLRRAAETYFGPIPREIGRPRLRLATDAFAIPTPAVRDALAPIARRIAREETLLYREGVEAWLDTFRPLQLQDLYATLGRWARAPGRHVTASIRQRIDFAAQTDPAAVAAAIPRREALARRLADDLADDGVLVVPTTHDLPPRRGAGLDALIAFREHTLALTCVASLARLPQVTLPAGRVGGVPVGLSFIAGPGRDELLAGAASMLAAEIGA